MIGGYPLLFYSKALSGVNGESPSDVHSSHILFGSEFTGHRSNESISKTEFSRFMFVISKVCESLN